MTDQLTDQGGMKSGMFEDLLAQHKKSSDRIMNYFLAAYFIFGLVLAGFYDTWLVAFGVGSLSLFAYYAARFLVPESNAYQYVLGVVLGMFMAQYIYQMHGMFEMHFVAFISSAVLIVYQNWKLQIPLTILVTLHHALFGYLQFIGVDEIYFTTMPYMDLPTFVIHVLLAAIIFFICGLWSYHLNRYKTQSVEQTFQLGLLLEKEKHSEEQRIAQDRIRQSEANLRSVFNNTDVGFILMDKDYRIVSYNENANAFARHIVGHPMIMGGFYYDHVPLNRKEQIIASLGKVAANEVLQYEIDYTRGRAQLWLDISMHPVLDDRQQLIGISVSLNNISQRKRMEKQMAYEKALKQTQITEAVFAAQENERTELGRELHDNVNQLLAASILYTQTARTAEAERNYLLSTSVTYTQEAIDEIRKLTRHLVTPRLSDFGLIKSLQGRAEDLMLVHQLRIHISCENFDEELFDEQFKLNLLRIVQEQINNTLKYAQAKNISIRFAVDNEHLLVTTTDDGIGFDVTKRNKGVGLTNMASRTELYRGEISICAAPGEGCSIAIRFPLKNLFPNTEEQVLVA